MRRPARGAGGVAGNVFTYAGAGVVLRYGRNLPDELPGTISLAPTRDSFAGAGGHGWLGWVGVDARSFCTARHRCHTAFARRAQQARVAR